MGLMQRRKGRAFEQQVANMLRERWPNRTVRRTMQSERAYEPDVLVEGIPIWWECHDAAKPVPLEKLRQALFDILEPSKWSAVKWSAVIVWHRIRERTVQATMLASDFVRWTCGPGSGPYLMVEERPLMEQEAVTLDVRAFLRLTTETLP